MSSIRSAPSRRWTRVEGAPESTLGGGLVAALQSTFSGPDWNGVALLPSLRGLSASDAVRRTPGGNNSIWEIVVHVAHTRHALLHRLGASANRRFPRPLPKAWWPALPETRDESSWRSDQGSLVAYHERLVATVEGLPPSRLAVVRPGKRVPLPGELAGCAGHDIYHTGQIRLIRQLVAGSR